MDEMMFTENTINNPDSPFTEIFSLLTLNGDFENYTGEQLRSLYLHSENAIDVILRGIQDASQMFGASKIQPPEIIQNFGFFISALANLSEALITLKENTNYILKQN
ncbi:MAG TPA: hypothetical protein VLI69_01715 [Gammaproteobacteria bacterium]|nr:hypothetical protein [Gammaproteobacteria bacterium]